MPMEGANIGIERKICKPLPCVPESGNLDLVSECELCSSDTSIDAQSLSLYRAPVPILEAQLRDTFRR
jgi:hypothetical protein